MNKIIIIFTISLFLTSQIHTKTPEEYGFSATSNSFHIKPTTLLTPYRFDIIAKYIYAKHREKNVDSNWAYNLYKNHIQAINNFYESSPYKKGINDFIKSFHETLDSIKQKGFDKNYQAIPIDKNFNPRDGAHRSAACILHKSQSICKKYNYEIRTDLYSSEYLKKRGLEEKYSDAMAIEYCMLKENTYIATVMPAAIGKNKEVEEIFSQYGTIVYRRDVFLNWNGAVNFIKQIYKEDSWIGNFNNQFAGAQYKARCCFPQNDKTKNYLRVFLFECSDLEKVKACKQKIRDLFGIQNHSVHINDTHEQTIEMAQTLLVQNSIHFLNHAKSKKFETFLKYFQQYKNWIKEKKINPKDLCIESGAVLSAYGVRDSSDIDFLHHNLTPLPKNKKFESHNKHHSKHDIDDIIYNPEKHFWYEDVKFACLQEVKKQKAQGGGQQNKKDVEAINSLIN